MRVFILIILVVSVGGLASHAQLHPNGYAVVSWAGILLADGQGRLSTVQQIQGRAWGCVMDNDNTTLLVTGDPSGLVWKVDPVSGTAICTLVRMPVGIRDIAVGQNGNYYVTSHAGTSSNDSIFRLRPDGTYKTVVTFGRSVQLWGGVEVDIDTGDLLVQEKIWSPDPLLSVTRYGGAITTLCTVPDSRWGITQHIPTGRVFIGTCCGDESPAESLYAWSPGQSKSTVWWSSAVAPVGAYAVKADRSSAASQRLIFGTLARNYADGGLYAIDVATRTVTRLAKIFSYYVCEVEILYRRNVSSKRTAQGEWDVRLRIPEDAGRSFVLAVSATGVRPALPLPDGRQICLVPDGLTHIGLTSGLDPFLTSTRGQLDAAGCATATLDVSGLRPAANGVKLWFLAITLDPAAPLGIATITDPHVIKIE